MMRKRLVLWGLVGTLVAINGWSGSVAETSAFSYVIDPELDPVVMELPAIGEEGEPRPVAAVVEPDGTQGDYVADEVILHGPTVEQLDVFVETYGGAVTFGGALPADPGNLPPDRLRPAYGSSDDYLVRVDVTRFDFVEEVFVAHMEARGHTGLYVFSSEEAVHLLALMLQEEMENDLEIALNPIMMPPPQPVETGIQGEAAAPYLDTDVGPASADCVMCKTEEHPVSGGYANSFTFSWLNDADLKATRAWQYYDLLEYAPSSPPVLAMVDVGFALNADFPSNVPQYDFETDSYTTIGNANTLPSGGKWHGTGTLGLAAARLNNRFGTAGTGGQVAFPYLFRPEGTLYGVAQAIRTAVYWGADVVNVSAADKGANIFEWKALAEASAKAANAGVIVLVTAGNNGGDGSDYYPCNIPGFLCVGGFDMGTKQAHPGSNHGSKIAVWGPYNGLQTTPNPDSGGALTGFGGTCGASAYVAGVVTLMRGVNPGLDAATAGALLQATANPSTDPKLANAGGILNAFGAVRAAAEGAGRKVQGDSYEPNDSSAAAGALPPGSSTATIAPEDVDVFTFETKDLVDLQLDVIYEDDDSPGNGLNARLDGSWGTTTAGTITLDQSLLTPGKHTLSVWGQYTDTINCYHTGFYTTASAISPDAYDDETPAGEVRNDTFASRAVIQGAVEASVLGPMGEISDLNFDVANDADFFEVTLAPAVDPTTGQSECILSDHPDYGKEGFTQGQVEISAWPDVWTPSTPGYTWPFELTVYAADGSVFTSTTGLRLAVDCPHQQFPNGKIRFSVKGKDGRRNFYRVFIHYSRWNVFYDVPLWVWEQTDPPLVRVLPPWGRWVEFRFPRDPAVIGAWAAGNPPDPVPREYGVFTWERLRDLDVILRTLGERGMRMTLYDASGEPIASAGAGGLAGPGTMGEEGHIHLEDLEPGTYVLGFQGEFGAVYSVSVGAPQVVYLPLAMRE